VKPVLEFRFAQCRYGRNSFLSAIQDKKKRRTFFLKSNEQKKRKTRGFTNLNGQNSQNSIIFDGI